MVVTVVKITNKNIAHPCMKLKSKSTLPKIVPVDIRFRGSKRKKNKKSQPKRKINIQGVLCWWRWQSIDFISMKNSIVCNKNHFQKYTYTHIVCIIKMTRWLCVCLGNFICTRFIFDYMFTLALDVEMIFIFHWHYWIHSFQLWYRRVVRASIKRFNKWLKMGKIVMRQYIQWRKKKYMVITRLFLFESLCDCVNWVFSYRIRHFLYFHYLSEKKKRISHWNALESSITAAVSVCVCVCV